MRVIVFCEESQAVTIAFRKRGHEAFSCDLQKASGGHPEWHIREDARKIDVSGYDLVIAHPPCTYLTSASANRLFDSNHNVKDLERETIYLRLLKP